MMKKLILATLCATAFGLTACEKKPNEATMNSTESSAASITTLSHGVNEDIRLDLETIQSLSNAKAQEALKFQEDVMQAAQKADKAEIGRVVASMDNYVDKFNDELDALQLKSSEADSIREKMKESNDLGLDLAEAGVETPPDMDKINALQKEASELQQTLVQDMQRLQNQVTTK